MTRIQNNCPRCGGNLFLDPDESNRYLYCLQCGRRIEIKSENEFHQHTIKGTWKTQPSPI